MSKPVVLIRHGDDPDDDRVVSRFRGCNIEPDIRRARSGDTPGAADHLVAVAFGKPGAEHDAARHHWFVNCLDRLFGAL